MRKSAFLLCILLAGCAALQEKIPLLGKKEAWVGGVYTQNINEDRVVDLSIVKKLTGEKSLGLFPKYTSYLEGYIRGIVVDYDDNPVEGVVVRVADKGRDLPGYDPGISDSNGIYRIRFSHPIKKKKVDLHGTLVFNPAWQQQYELVGSALEPQTKETNFRLYYDQSTGLIGFGEDMPKTIVRKATGVTKEPAPGSAKADKEKKIEKPPVTNSPPANLPKKKDDFFGGFGNFGQ